MKRRGLWAAAILVMLTNAIVLAEVAYNRSGEANAVMQLTERELAIYRTDKENSEVALRLRAQQHSVFNRMRGPKWFDRSKLEALGFDCTVPIESDKALLHYSKAVSRKAFVVLEYGEDGWNKFMNLAKEELRLLSENGADDKRSLWELDNAKISVKNLSKMESRLVAIDVGLDSTELRNHYSDRTKFIVTPAEISLVFFEDVKDEEGYYRPPYLGGRITKILVDKIHVTNDKRKVLDQYPGEEVCCEPRYTVTLSYGRRLEPWIKEIQPTTPAGPS